MLLDLIALLLYALLQLYTLVTWRGGWRAVGVLTVIPLLVGCVRGWNQNSNLWPFWGFPYSPYSLVLLTALAGIRFVTMRAKKKVQKAVAV